MVVMVMVVGTGRERGSLLALKLLSIRFSLDVCAKGLVHPS